MLKDSIDCTPRNYGKNNPSVRGLKAYKQSENNGSKQIIRRLQRRSFPLTITQKLQLTDLIHLLGPFFERYFRKSGPGGIQQKKLEN
jgi:hypothetical protein